MKKLLFSMFLLLMTAIGAVAQSGLTVNEGSATSSYVPIYGLYVDSYLKCEYVIPATELGDMANGTISAMKFYLTTPATASWGTPNFQVFLKEVEATTISEYAGTEGATIVYEGALDGTNSEMEITFSTPYTYNGGNLLVGVYNTNPATYKSATFAGIAAEGACVQGYNGTSLDDVTVNQRNFLPKTTFTFSPAAGACIRPYDITVNGLTSHSATISWTAGFEETAWQLCLSDDEDHLFDVTTNPYVLDGLEADSAYTVKLRSVCGENEESAWTLNVPFRTTVSCPAPTALTLAAFTSTSATLTWTIGAEESNWVIWYGTDNTFADYTEVTATNTTVELSGLTPETVYYAKIKAVCDVDEESEWSEVLSFEPTAKIVIGSGTATNSYLPTYIFYNYSLTQQIYTAAEIGATPGAIMSVDFYTTGTATRSLDIYMVATDKATFEGTADWITASAADLVYSGNVAFAANAWTTIELDAPFIYDGTNNVAIIVDDNTGDYASSIQFRVFDATSQAIRDYNDNTNYDPTAPASTSNASVLNVKNQIRFLIGEPPTCIKPRALTVSEINKRTAVLSWTAAEGTTAWQICLNGNEVNLIAADSNPFTLTGLEPETEYTAKVRTYCAEDDQSDWSNEINFTTLEACAAPQGLAVSDVTSTSANVTWNGDAESYNLRYRPTDNSMATVILTAGDVWGDGSGYQMLLDADATAFGTIIPETGALTTSGDATAAQYAEFEYKIPENADGALTTSNIVINNSIAIMVPAGVYDWCITNPTPGDRMWIASSNGNVGGRYDDFEFVAGATYEFTVSLGDNGNDEVNLTTTGRARKNTRDAEWTVVNNVTSPYTITGLTPDQSYEVQVMAVCGEEDGESEWTNSRYFTTISTCPTPVSLQTSNITETSATLAWTGYQEDYNIHYRVAAGRPALYFTDFEDETLPEGWTTIDSDNDGYNWVTSYAVGGVYLQEGADLSGTGYESSNGFMMSGSFSNVSGEALTPDNWLISPQVELGGLVAFYAKGQDASYAAEHFAIYVSTTGTNTANFVQVSSEFVATGSWAEYTADLSSYSGMGYVAIRHYNCTDEFVLDVDNFGIYGAELPAGEWIDVTPNDNPYTLENLTPGTSYEWQVQGICEGEELTDWSATASFTTPSTVSVLDAEATLAIYPNPNNGMFNIEFSNIEGNATYQLIDARGSIVETNNINVSNGETMSFNHNLKAGTYFVRIITAEKVYVEQIVVE